MSLSEMFRLVKKVEPGAVRHRDHICCEPATHDWARCPKATGRQYAWRAMPNYLWASGAARR